MKNIPHTLAAEAEQTQLTHAEFVARLDELCQALRSLEQEYHAKTDRTPWWVVLPGLADWVCIFLAGLVLVICAFAPPARFYPFLLAGCFIGHELFRYTYEESESRFAWMKEKYLARINRLAAEIDRLCHTSPRE